MRTGDARGGPQELVETSPAHLRMPLKGPSQTRSPGHHPPRPAETQHGVTSPPRGPASSLLSSPRTPAQPSFSASIPKGPALLLPPGPGGLGSLSLAGPLLTLWLFPGQLQTLPLLALTPELMIPRRSGPQERNFRIPMEVTQISLLLRTQHIQTHSVLLKSAFSSIGSFSK